MVSIPEKIRNIYNGDPRVICLLGKQKKPKEEKKLRKSVFVFKLYLEGHYLLFHTLTRQILFVELELVDWFMNGRSFSLDVLQNETAAWLYDHYFLVPEDEQESRTYMEVKDLMEISGSYPYGPSAKITMKNSVPADFELKLRIPEWWNEHCVLKVNGESLSADPGSWRVVSRKWSAGDVIEFCFDLTVRRIEAPGDPSSEAFMSGSVVLAESSRLPKSAFPLPEDAVFTDQKPSNGFKCLKAVSGGGMLGDYASAGNKFLEDDLLQVWFPHETLVRTPYARGFDIPPQLKS